MAGMEIKGLIEALSYTASAVRTLKDIDDKVKRNDAVFSIQESLLSAQQIALDNQQQMAAIVESKGALEKEIAALRGFEAEKSRYVMHETKFGGFTYRIKEDARNGEPSHHICANCCQESVKSILQKEGIGLKCIKCSLFVQTSPRGPVHYVV